jgi:hypothetical protein
LLANFDVIAANVSHLEDAEVICIGETHTNQQHRRNLAALVDSLATKGDLLLLEYDQRKAFRTKQAEFIQTPLLTLGWDQTSEKPLHSLQEIYDDLPRRNAYMTERIAPYALPGRRIFVIAGKDHFLPASPSEQKQIIDRQGQETAYAHLLSFLETKKFVILVPKLYERKSRFCR